MPWSTSDVERHNKGLGDKQKEQWVAVANSALASCIEDGGDEDECEASAIRQANSVVSKEQEPGGPETCVCPECGYETEKERGVPCRSVECPECGATLVAGAEEAQSVDDVLTWLGEQFRQMAEKLAEIEDALEQYRMDEAKEGDAVAERASGRVVGLVESEDGSGPLHVDIVPIRPGWGNKRDNHYYTAEAVRKAAPIWLGAKMYATDHRDEEKSVLTEVSEVVQSPVGHTDDGVPIARVAIINPQFAEMVRMRDEAGILGNLHCSILARGLVEKDEFEDEETGRKGHRVTEILSDDVGIDWVTRAGAGGHALPLAEAAAEEETMPDEEHDVAETEERELREGDDEEQEQEEAQETEEVQETEPEPLTEARVVEILADTDLSEQAREALAHATYADEEALSAAVASMREAVKAAARSGQPFGMGGGEQAPPQGVEEREKARYARFNEIMRRHGAKEIPLPAHLKE